MNIQKEIRASKSIKDKAERLERLNEIAQELASQFTDDMDALETEIDFVLERTPNRIKDELEYYTVADVTQDIMVKRD